MIVKKKFQLAKSLLYFIDVVRTGKLKTTAELNGIKTSNLSRILRGLENELGLKLLVRVSKGMVPTENGRAIYEMAVQMEESLKEINKLLLHNDHTTKLNVFVEEGISISGWNELLKLKPRLQVKMVATPQEADLAVVSHQPEAGTGKIAAVHVIGTAIKQKIYFLISSDNDAATDFYKFLVTSMI